MTAPKTIVWFRKDLRLSDNHALSAAAARGQVIPLFIYDDVFETTLGAAQKLRLDRALAAFSRACAAAGAPLILRRGDALTALKAVIAETGATAVEWTRLTDKASIARDTAVKAALKADGIEATSHGGFTLTDPWTVKSGSGAPYKVYTPYWRAVSAREIERPLPRTATLAGAGQIASDDLDDWNLAKPMGPAAGALAEQFDAGEDAALARLNAFLSGGAADYARDRDQLSLTDGTSQLSDHLALGEISPRQIWWALKTRDGEGFEGLARQIVWRDFAHQLLFQDPEMETTCWRREWEDFHWPGGDEVARKWKAGRTGITIVDAAMRELWVTGRMHNRARMIVASLLTKNLRTDWRVGAEWFRHTLIDWDPANNAMGWQWVAGCGPDAAPYFRIFNPDTQAEKFDKSGTYRKYWLDGGPGASSFRQMWPASDVTFAMASRPLMVDLATTRKAALTALDEMKLRQNAVSRVAEESV